METEKHFDGQEFISRMQRHGLPLPPTSLRIRIPNAREVFGKCYKWLLAMQGRQYMPQPEYDKVVQWLEDNEGKGLLLFGNCGRGKSFIARFVIPAIMLKYKDKALTVVNATDMNEMLAELKKKKILVIDDLGCEYVANVFGNKKNAFDEIIDKAEQDGNILIITTNLTRDELMERYGERVIGRLNALTKNIAFTGEDLRVLKN